MESSKKRKLALYSFYSLINKKRDYRRPIYAKRNIFGEQNLISDMRESDEYLHFKYFR